ncbi:MAG TPA: protein phosphatase 2C domain-containing protein [Stellaceae bacterium]|nr:protein phosphatase 2C domain-containing protein [Stellaceae bacterium]
MKGCATTEIGPAGSLSVSGTMLTHPGLIRQNNEDVVVYVLPDEGKIAAARGALALVADGMGGHAAGEVASAIAADTVRRLYYALDGTPGAVLEAAFAAANEAIYRRSRTDPACAGMGTTCTALAWRGGAAFLAHIGDSRAYLWRAGCLRQISEDHSLVAQLVRDGALTKAQAAKSPQRHVILRALGTEPTAEPAVWPQGLPLRPGDVFVLCSDGLTDLVDDGTIGDIVGRLSPAEACAALIAAALAAGGADNVSVGVFAIEAARPQASDAETTRPRLLSRNAP